MNPTLVQSAIVLIILGAAVLYLGTLGWRWVRSAFGARRDAGCGSGCGCGDGGGATRARVRR